MLCSILLYVQMRFVIINTFVLYILLRILYCTIDPLGKRKYTIFTAYMARSEIIFRICVISVQ